MAICLSLFNFYFFFTARDGMWNKRTCLLNWQHSGSPRIVQSQVALVVKNLPANSGDIRDAGSIPRSGRSPRERHGNPLQYSCLGNPMDRGAWWATVYSAAKSQTRPKWLSTHTHTQQVLNTWYYTCCLTVTGETLDLASACFTI